MPPALNGTGINGVGRPLRAKDAASVIKRLRDDLNAELKERLFGYPSISDVPANFAHHNACGRLLLNAIADLASSAAGNSAAVLKSAFEERRDDAPFLSALETLASSSQVMRFINFFFDNEDVLRWEALNADDSRLSIGSEKSGATTITETSDSANRADKSMFRIENSKSTSSDNVTGRKYSSTLSRPFFLLDTNVPLQRYNSHHKKSFKRLKLQQWYYFRSNRVKPVRTILHLMRVSACIRIPSASINYLLMVLHLILCLLNSSTIKRCGFLPWVQISAITLRLTPFPRSYLRVAIPHHIRIL